jgi:superfamily I DNA/RNA helicase
MNVIWDIIRESEHCDAAFLLHGSVNDAFPRDKQVIVSTFHAAKGMELRALHLAACDELKSSFFLNNRRMTFTAVTRAKTAISVYHCNGLHGYFEAALQSVKPVPKPPSLEDLFGRSR